MLSDGSDYQDSTKSEEVVHWLERTLPRLMRSLLDSEDLNIPLLQLPLAQLRLAQALYKDTEAGVPDVNAGDSMGRLSERLGVKLNALTPSADRLIQRGLAERFSDPTDRRVVRMRLTERGQEWVRERRTRRHAHLTRLWHLMDRSDQAHFVQAVKTLEAASKRLQEAPVDQKAGMLSIHAPSRVEEKLTQMIADV